jgi:hypothetical protein
MIEASRCGASAILAMKLVDQVGAIGRIAPAVHRDYRPMFESGWMEQLMRFLSMGDVPHGRITRVSESIDISIKIIRCWWRELLQNPNWQPMRALLYRRPCPQRLARVGFGREAPGRVCLGGPVLSSGDCQLSCVDNECRVAGPRMRCPPEPPARRFEVLTLRHYARSPLSSECAFAVRFPQ